MACFTCHEEVSVSIVPDKHIIIGDVAGLPVLVSVKTPEGQERTPSDICCVIDTSWSMSMEATVQSAAGKSESNGLSMLDVAKHAVRTVIRTLGPKDRVAIVEFCRNARVVLPLLEMDDDGKRVAEAKCDEIVFGPGTNLWNGLNKALMTLREKASPDRFGHIMLLTDGETEERKDVMKHLIADKMTHERLPGTINAFGFGYEIDSDLLVEIAAFGDGTYAFIPDAGFVGTIFVNSMSNLLATLARDARLSLQADSGAEIKSIMGGWEAKKNGDNVYSINLGNLQSGQSKDIVVLMDVKGSSASDEPYLVASLDFSTLKSKFTCTAEANAGEKLASTDLVEPHRCRLAFVDALEKAASIAKLDSGLNLSEDKLEEAQNIIKEVATQILASGMKDDEKVAALLEDVQGQCCEALSRLDYWKKWGRHYTPSVMFAHRLQQCNNFKDPGVQFYGGQVFRDLQTTADNAFDSLPAPKLTPAMWRYTGNGRVIMNPSFVHPTRTTPRTGAAPAPAVSMAAYNDRYSGCIDGSSLTALASGEPRYVSDVAKGDRLAAFGGKVVDVICVVRTRCNAGHAALVELPGGLRLTPYHPVQVSGKWCFPADLAAAQVFPCDAVYSFVLQGAPDLLAGGVPCIGLGHGIEEGAAKHSYFGTDRVLMDLESLPGYGSGHVELPEGCFVRDPETGIVCGLRGMSKEP